MMEGCTVSDAVSKTLGNRALISFFNAVCNIVESGILKAECGGDSFCSTFGIPPGGDKDECLAAGIDCVKTEVGIGILLL